MVTAFPDPAGREGAGSPEHWIHRRTTNPSESTFATVRHRTELTTGPGPVEPPGHRTAAEPPARGPA
jgi:hypothetical protein